MIHARAGAVLVALALFVRAGQGASQLGDWCEEAGFSLRLPPGWTVEREAPGRGAALRPPDARPGLVELVVWRVSVGVVNVQGAAAEHERLLSASMPYERLRSEPIAAGPMGEGLYVEGAVELPNDGRAVSLFAAFLTGERAYVVGTFAAASDVDEARRDRVDPVVRGLSLLRETAEGEPLTDVRPLPPPEPGEGTTAPLLPGPPPGVTPAAAEPAERDQGTEPGPEQYEDAAGFSLDLPRGWRCEVHDSVVRVSSSGGAAAYILPVLCTGTEVGKVATEAMVALALNRAGIGEITACQECGRAGRCVWVWVGVGSGERLRTGPFALVVEGPVGLLAGVVSSEREGEQAWRTGARIIASFRASFEGSSADRPPSGETSWTDPSGALECTPPVGWRLQGGVLTYDKAPAIDLRGERVAGPPAWFVWSQPIRPVFRDLTDAMRGLGFRDGDPYYAYDGVDRRMVLTRGGPADLTGRYLLTEELLPATSLRIVAQEEPAVALDLLGSGDERSAIVSLIGSSGARVEQAWCAVSQQTTQPSRGGWFWEAACLCFGGATGEGLTAARALEVTMESARLGADGDDGTRRQLDVLLGQLPKVRASEAWQNLVGNAAVAPARLVARGAGEGNGSYSVPDAASELWRDVATGVLQPCGGAGMTALRGQTGG